MNYVVSEFVIYQQWQIILANQNFIDDHFCFFVVSLDKAFLNDIWSEFVAAESHNIAFDVVVNARSGGWIQGQKIGVVLLRVLLQVKADGENSLDHVVAELIEHEQRECGWASEVLYDSLGVTHMELVKDLLNHSTPVHMHTQHVNFVDHCLHYKRGLSLWQKLKTFLNHVIRILVFDQF